MAKGKTKAQLEKDVARLEREQHGLFRVLNAILRDITPEKKEVAPVYASNTVGVKVAECTMFLYECLRADGGIVLVQNTYEDGSPMNWTIHRLDDRPFMPELTEYCECRYAWERLLAFRQEQMTKGQG